MATNTRELKAKASLLRPLARIGKAGLTSSQIKELNKLLEKHKLIKVKFLRPFLGDRNKKEVAEELAEKTQSEIIQQVGFTVVLYKN